MKETKIGSRIKKVIDKPNPEVPDTNDASLLKEISGLKERLLKKWKDVYNRHKGRVPNEERKDTG